MQAKTPLRIVVALLCAVCSQSVFAQVDKTSTSQDTLYIIEEEVTYDTLYLYDSQIDPELMSKEELLEAFRRDRGIGRLYYSHGNMFITGTDGELYKLDNTDLQGLLPTDDYTKYLKAKRNIYTSIPLYVAGGCAFVWTGIGIYQFSASIVLMARCGTRMFDYEHLASDIWRNILGGFLFTFGGGIVSTGFLVPAIILNIKGKANINSIVNDFNTPPTALRLNFGPSPGGIGLTLSF